MLLVTLNANAGVKVAFIGDQGTHSGAREVLQLIADEGTDLVLIQGDLGYEENKYEKWDQNITDILGKDFPVLSVIGNHDEDEWPEYKALIEERVWRDNGLNCSGNIGAKAFCQFDNIDIVQVAPGLNAEGIDPNDDYAGFINSSLQGSSNRWRICSWHMNQRRMQTGNKSDATGWGVYNTCLNLGALVATGHEHAYSRTHLMSNFENQSIAQRDGTMTLQPGRSLAFVSGLGGWEARPQVRNDDWWASIYTSSQGAAFGALFCYFEDDRADCYFKAVNGAEPDRFALRNGTFDSAPDSGSGSNQSQPNAPELPALLTPPNNVRSDVYSQSAIEIFWDRKSDNDLNYRVSVNDEPVAVTDGTSHFLDGLEAGQRYVIDVLTVDSYGRLSAGASTVAYTPGW